MASILNFDNFHTNIKETFEPEEKSRMREIGLDSLKKFNDGFAVLDFFGGSLPLSYESAKMEANQAGYELSTSLYDEAAMMAEDGEEMYESTEAEVAQKKSAIESEDAEIAKAEADLAVRSQNIKPLDPSAMAQRQLLQLIKRLWKLEKQILQKREQRLPQ